MHELSIAENILDIVRDSVKEPDLENVRKVKVKLGEMSGVVADSLEFCFHAIVLDTNLSRTLLEVEKIPFLLKCNDCGAESTNEYGLRSCTECGSYQTEVVSGTELLISEIELV